MIDMFNINPKTSLLAGSLFTVNILDLDLDLAKKYLNIDENFTDDDEFIELCLVSAKSYIQSYLNWGNLYEVENLPTELTIAALLLMSHFYEQRKIVDSNTKEVTMTLSSILNLHKSYSFGADISE